MVRVLFLFVIIYDRLTYSRTISCLILSLPTLSNNPLPRLETRREQRAESKRQKEEERITEAQRVAEAKRKLLHEQAERERKEKEEAAAKKAAKGKKGKK